MTTATKTLAEMTTSELLEADAAIGNELDNPITAFFREGDESSDEMLARFEGVETEARPVVLLRRRREIREELESRQRHGCFGGDVEE